MGHYLFEQILVHLPFDRFIAVSHFTGDRLARHTVPESKIVVIYNGIDYAALNDYRHDPPKYFTYCYFGRLGISKGLDVLLTTSCVVCCELVMRRVACLMMRGKNTRWSA